MRTCRCRGSTEGERAVGRTGGVEGHHLEALQRASAHRRRRRADATNSTWKIDSDPDSDSIEGNPFFGDFSFFTGANEQIKEYMPLAGGCTCKVMDVFWMLTRVNGLGFWTPHARHSVPSHSNLGTGLKTGFAHRVLSG